MIKFVLGEQRLCLLTQSISCVTLWKVPENWWEPRFTCYKKPNSLLFSRGSWCIGELYFSWLPMALSVCFLSYVSVSTRHSSNAFKIQMPVYVVQDSLPFYDIFFPHLFHFCLNHYFGKWKMRSIIGKFLLFSEQLNTCQTSGPIWIWWKEYLTLCHPNQE